VKIVVLVKQVPRPDSISFDDETKSLRREGVPLELNAFDAGAVREAVRLRDAQGGGEVVAMTMGPPQAEAALRTCLALGADRCVHLSDRVFAVADTIGTSRTLALAVRAEGADLVLTGRKATDAETCQVPPETAALLGWPQLTGAVAIDVAGDGLRATRETDDGVEVYDVPLPAIVSVGLPERGETIAAAGPGNAIEVRTATELVDHVEEYDKRFGQTGSPTRVLAVRAVTPERAGVRAPNAADAFEQIRTLLAGRPAETTDWEKPPRLGEQPGESYDCWTAVELVDGLPTRGSLELLGKGRELSGKLGGDNVALLLGTDLVGAMRVVERQGADRIVAVEDERLSSYHPELYASALRQVLERERPHVLLIPSSANGRDFGPRAAGELGLGMTADCVALGIDRAGRLIQTKPAYGGNIVSVIMGATTPQLATVRPRMFEPLEPREPHESATAPLEMLPLTLPEPRLRLVERHRNADARKLDEAEVVLLVGAPLGEEGVAEAHALAAAAGWAIGGTQEVCERGWLPRNHHVGLLGRSVAPRLLVAVEVPGEFEPLTGVVKAAVILGVAADDSAPVLDAADVAVVGDWRTILTDLADLWSPG
jgi:electron transfer flavoprotein alpha subunit